MIKISLAFVMITSLTKSIGPTPTTGIFVYDLPEELVGELPGAKSFINNSHTKWLETYNIRSAPLDLEDPKLPEVLAGLNGVFIPGGIEVYAKAEKLANYRDQISKICDIALEINKTKPFAIVATGFGAQLLIAKLTNYQLNAKPVNTARQSVSLTFKKVDNSEFYKSVSNLDDLSKALYPLNTNWQISTADFNNVDAAKNQFNIIATSIGVDKSQTEFLMMFESKLLPIYGILTDIEMIQFNHADDGFTDKSAVSGEAAFQLVKFFASQYNKNSTYKPEPEVLVMKKGWNFHLSPLPSGEYEDILWK